jgi:hypothetical protein
MQRELFGYSGLRYLFALLVCQACGFFFGSLFVAAWWLDRSGLASLPAALLYAPLWLFYGALAVLIVMLWDALSATAFRLVTAKWPRIFWRAVVPSLTLAAFAAASVHSGSLSTAEPRASALAFALVAGVCATAVHVGIALAVALKIGRLRKRGGEWRGIVDRLEGKHGEAALARVERSHALVAGETAGNPRAAPPALVGLTSKPWHDTRDLPWVAAFESHFEAIRAEALEVLTGERRSGRALSGSGGGAGLLKHHYPGVGAQGWESFRFIVAGQEIRENCNRCPRTAEALKHLPRYPQFVESMFSVLGPGGRIAAHRDILNVWLTCHLPLIVPDGCGIRVGGIAREWKEAEVLLFDASYEHEAWNHSDQPRVVLITDILHPEINDAEAELLRWFHWTMIP